MTLVFRIDIEGGAYPRDEDGLIYQSISLIFGSVRGHFVGVQVVNNVPVVLTPTDFLEQDRTHCQSLSLWKDVSDRQRQIRNTALRGKIWSNWEPYLCAFL